MEPKTDVPMSFRITELEEKETNTESSTQTSLLPEVVSPALVNTAWGTEPEPAEAPQQNSGKEKVDTQIGWLRACLSPCKNRQVIEIEMY